MYSANSFHSGKIGNELRTIKREIDELFESLSQKGNTWASSLWRESSLLPLVNLRETNDRFLVTCEVPGMKIKDLDIQIEGEVLTLRGERKTDALAGQVSYLRRERATGSFQRSLTLPRAIDEESVTAIYKKGVLTVILMKEYKKPSHRIRVSYE
ncbi:MAG: Hsp20/alpha crystallin family protein [Deltaproteobacteria bacterium]|nr:Hsp20/alpha crystallin family protein [Deltaproteobacteria bacterium]